MSEQRGQDKRQVGSLINSRTGFNSPARYYTWHDQAVRVLTWAPFMRGVKRNALVETSGGKRLVVPMRALRRVRETLPG